MNQGFEYRERIDRRGRRGRAWPTWRAATGTPTRRCGARACRAARSASTRASAGADDRLRAGDVAGSGAARPGRSRRPRSPGPCSTATTTRWAVAKPRVACRRCRTAASPRTRCSTRSPRLIRTPCLFIGWAAARRGWSLPALTPLARRAVSAAGRTARVEKVYRALAVGVPARSALTIDAPIGPVAHPRLGSVHAALPAGKPAVSHVRVLEPRAGTSLLEVSIETGRPHQIRIHLAWAGHPLVGDPVYGPEAAAARSRPARRSRLPPARAPPVPRAPRHGPAAALEVRAAGPVGGHEPIGARSVGRDGSPALRRGQRVGSRARSPRGD